MIVGDPQNADIEVSRRLESLLTVQDVAKILRLEPETVRNMARKGELPALHVGRVWRFVPEQIKVWLLNQQGNPNSG